MDFPLDPPGKKDPPSTPVTQDGQARAQNRAELNRELTQRWTAYVRKVRADKANAGGTLGSGNEGRDAQPAGFTPAAYTQAKPVFTPGKDGVPAFNAVWKPDYRQPGYSIPVGTQAQRSIPGNASGSVSTAQAGTEATPKGDKNDTGTLPRTDRQPAAQADGAQTDRSLNGGRLYLASLQEPAVNEGPKADNPLGVPPNKFSSLTPDQVRGIVDRHMDTYDQHMRASTTGTQDEQQAHRKIAQLALDEALEAAYLYKISSEKGDNSGFDQVNKRLGESSPDRAVVTTAQNRAQEILSDKNTFFHKDGIANEVWRLNEKGFNLGSQLYRLQEGLENPASRQDAINFAAGYYYNSAKTDFDGSTGRAMERLAGNKGYKKEYDSAIENLREATKDGRPDNALGVPPKRISSLTQAQVLGIVNEHMNTYDEQMRASREPAASPDEQQAHRQAALDALDKALEAAYLYRISTEKGDNSGFEQVNKRLGENSPDRAAVSTAQNRAQEILDSGIARDVRRAQDGWTVNLGSELYRLQGELDNPATRQARHRCRREIRCIPPGRWRAVRSYGAGEPD